MTSNSKKLISRLLRSEFDKKHTDYTTAMEIIDASHEIGATLEAMEMMSDLEFETAHRNTTA